MNGEMGVGCAAPSAVEKLSGSVPGGVFSYGITLSVPISLLLEVSQSMQLKFLL